MEAFLSLSRKRHELKTFVSAVIITISVLDIIDVLRVLPVLPEYLYGFKVFRHVFCSFGVFHELAVAVFLIAISVAVCCQVCVLAYNLCQFLKQKISALSATNFSFSVVNDHRMMMMMTIPLTLSSEQSYIH